MFLKGFKPVKCMAKTAPSTLRELKYQADLANIEYQLHTHQQMPNLLSPTWRFDTLVALRLRFGKTPAFETIEQQIEKHYGLNGLRLFLAVRTMAREIYRLESLA